MTATMKTDVMARLKVEFDAGWKAGTAWARRTSRELDAESAIESRHLLIESCRPFWPDGVQEHAAEALLLARARGVVPAGDHEVEGHAPFQRGFLNAVACYWYAISVGITDHP